MTPVIGLNPAKQAIAITQEKPCCKEILEHIAAIWKRVYVWICEWVSWLISAPEHNLAKRCPDAFCNAMKYLSPEEVGRCETVCKSWKMPDKVWKAQCASSGVTSCPASGRYKGVFQIPKMAFGPREWVKHGWGEPGPIPSLPANIAVTAAKLKETYTLTLIPATVGGQPLSFNTFAPLAEKSGMRLRIDGENSILNGNKAVGKSLWVWMQKEIEPNSRNNTQEQAKKDYPQKLGKALWITISIVAHYARYKICLFPNVPKGGDLHAYTRPYRECI